MLSKSDPTPLPNTTKAFRTRNLCHVFFWVLITFYGTSQVCGAYRIFQNKKAKESPLKQKEVFPCIDLLAFHTCFISYIKVKNPCPS